MSGASSFPALSGIIDVGSWTGFSSSLAVFLDEQVRPHSLDGEGPGLTVLLTAPAPVVTDDALAAPAPGAGLRSLWRRRWTRPSASPDLPGVILVGRADGVEVDVPAQDPHGRLLLGDEAREQLMFLGWRTHEDMLARLLPDGTTAARAVTRLLIEVLHVAHPADMDCLATDQR